MGMGYTSIYAAMEIWASIFFVIATIWMYMGRKLAEPKEYTSMRNLLLSATVVLAADAFAWLFRGYPGAVGAFMVRISNFLVFFVSYGLLYALGDYIAFSCRMKGVPQWQSAIRILCAVGAAMIVISQFTGMFYGFTEDNLYYRTDLHWMSQVEAYAVIVIISIVFILYRKQMARRRFLVFNICYLIMVLSVIVQTFVYGYSLSNIAIAISVMMIFGDYMIHTSEVMVENMEELQSLKIRSMMSQIKPHFIYNVLNSIYFLCEIDPKKAQKGISTFANYLRGNLDSLGTDGCIEMSTEMKHVRNYMELELMRFGEDLNVIYDIQEDGFLLPALSVQTLAENAVKHGITASEDGGTVWISSKDCGDHYEVEVRDDGVGYHPEKNRTDDGRSHTGILNIRSRLKEMCGGDLKVHLGKDGTGTVALITIPKEKRS